MKIKHICNSSEFKTIIKSGKKLQGEVLSFYYQLVEGEVGVFVGVVVSKKVAALAVVRNYVKRRTYSFFNYEQINPINGQKVVVKVKTDIKNFNRRELSKKLLKDLKYFRERCDKKANEGVYLSHDQDI